MCVKARGFKLHVTCIELLKSKQCYNGVLGDVSDHLFCVIFVFFVVCFVVIF